MKTLTKTFTDEEIARLVDVCEIMHQTLCKTIESKFKGYSDLEKIIMADTVYTSLAKGSFERISGVDSDEASGNMIN